jgi:putative flippase GtrA
VNRLRVTGVRWLKFNAVGSVGMVVQLLVLAGLKGGLHVHYLMATGWAVEAAVIHNFFWHARFTWDDRASHDWWTRFLKFNLTNGLFSLLGNLVFMKLLVEIVNWNYMLANLVTIAMCSMVNFMVADRFVFDSAA